MDEGAGGDGQESAEERGPEAAGGRMGPAPWVTRMGPEGAIRIPEEVRIFEGFEEGDQVLVVPTGDGILVRTLELPTVGEYAEWVERRAEELGVSPKEVEDVIHRYIAGESTDGEPEEGEGFPDDG
ncbi:MAG: hypothetical protein MAG715_00502 [Methanonatronarchaeales archaeon]|nr:hypothetical protein [Methanonatronarchaeales archaeon]